MSAVVADTHIAVWYLATPDKLSSNALVALDEADATGGPIYVASISVVEVAYLIEKGRLPEIVYERLIGELSRPDSALAVVPLDLSVARALRRIPRAAVPEMPDRIIAATALYLGLPLVTCDLRIRLADITTIW
jgi:PIN domain nuclease of toxin-antitoxin system